MQTREGSEVSSDTGATGSAVAAAAKREPEEVGMEVDEIEDSDEEEGAEARGGREGPHSMQLDPGSMMMMEGMRMDRLDAAIASGSAHSSVIGNKGQRPLTQNQRNADVLVLVERAVVQAQKVIAASNGTVDSILVEGVGLVDGEGPLPRRGAAGEEGGGEGKRKARAKGPGKGKGQGREYAGDPNMAWRCYHSKCGKMYTACVFFFVLSRRVEFSRS